MYFTNNFNTIGINAGSTIGFGAGGCKYAKLKRWGDYITIVLSYIIHTYEVLNKGSLLADQLCTKNALSSEV